MNYITIKMRQQDLYHIMKCNFMKNSKYMDNPVLSLLLDPINNLYLFERVLPSNSEDEIKPSSKGCSYKGLYGAAVLTSTLSPEKTSSVEGALLMQPLSNFP